MPFTKTYPFILYTSFSLLTHSYQKHWSKRVETPKSWLLILTSCESLFFQNKKEHTQSQSFTKLYPDTTRQPERCSRVTPPMAALGALWHFPRRGSAAATLSAAASRPCQTPDGWWFSGCVWIMYECCMNHRVVNSQNYGGTLRGIIDKSLWLDDFCEAIYCMALGD